MWTLAVHNIVANFSLTGDMSALTGETADVRACIGNLKGVCCEEFFHVDFCIYNHSKASALYNMGEAALAFCSLHRFSSCLPQFMSFTQGTLSSALPVKIISFLICH